MSDPVTLAVTDHVPLAEKSRYEALVEELHQLFQAQQGFLSVDIVRHNRPHQVEYTVLSRWSDQAAATQWQQDTAIERKLAEIKTVTGGTAQIVEATGLGMWVDHAQGLAPKLPPVWKRVAMSVVAVYPMLMLLMGLSAPIIGGLPQPIQVLVIVIVLSALLTWPIMPWLEKVLRPWLEA
ncbi:antibiotic biosynthesis monooxygenase [Candidatus Halocynthiibacter alkanivorans]|uniref:antibiotic biosynthesis monooxygenase n=1 Tax=Candidatus Halocynthiibacter alkanivorans TaxID=2267619 RepID=UPI000DF48817|nr:antibiotic biosynthesis monooxygenase [Candidatus Halocynthiibacter alkanivorans]